MRGRTIELTRDGEAIVRTYLDDGPRHLAIPVAALSVLMSACTPAETALRTHPEHFTPITVTCYIGGNKATFKNVEHFSLDGGDFVYQYKGQWFRVPYEQNHCSINIGESR